MGTFAKISVSTETEKKLKSLTPIIDDYSGYQEADEEFIELGKYITSNISHNRDVDVKRIKFLYSDKLKKEGGNFSVFSLYLRSDIERMINDNYDFVIAVYYPVWKDLEVIQKITLLDKALCGIDLGDMEHEKLAKKSPDSKEYKTNMKCFGEEYVMNLSEIVELACQRIADEKKENKKNAKKQRNHEEIAD